MVTGEAWSEGQMERHAWCVMSVGGVLTQTDPTWNDQEQLGANTYWYFNLTDAQMAADHRVDEGLILPPCTDESASWHSRNGLVVPATGGEVVVLAALERFATEKTAVNLRFENAADAAACPVCALRQAVSDRAARSTSDRRSRRQNIWRFMENLPKKAQARRTPCLVW